MFLYVGAAPIALDAIDGRWKSPMTCSLPQPFSAADGVEANFVCIDMLTGLAILAAVFIFCP